MPDHIHIFVDVPQTVAPCDVVRTLKSISAIELFKVYPQLKKFYARCGALWSGGYFVSTVVLNRKLYPSDNCKLYYPI